MGNRPLSPEEHRLARWLLEHGTSDAASFLSQLENAEITPDRCKCGCASIGFQIKGLPIAPPGVNVLSEYFFGSMDELCGIFIFENEGVLSGIEVFGYGVDNPTYLPTPEMLRATSSDPAK
jgi:hypothetical protein